MVPSVATGVLLLVIVILVVALAASFQQWSIIRRTEQRLREAGELNRSLVPEPDEQRGAVGNWLYLAGFKAPGADWVFLMLLLVLIVFGLSVGWALTSSGYLNRAALNIEQMPGGAGNIFLPFVFLLPWVIIVFVVLLPILVVNAARARRVAAVEADLLVFLELMATLTESGLSFDGALSRILRTQPQSRPLFGELGTLQKDFLAGRSRVVAYRRFARRLDIMSVNVFVSAIVQSEMVGSSIAETLRAQAETIRARRRDTALSWVMSAPTRLLFPLAICFLPAIFLFALGPSYYTVLQFIDMIIQQVPR
jgi:tight adherence protein C